MPKVKRREPTEWLMCKYSALYWIRAFGHVYDATARTWQPFTLWPAQRDVLLAIENHRLTVILKARQLGMSWLVVGYALWLMLFRPAATVLFFSKRDDEAVHLLNFRLRGMLQRLPAWLQPALITDNAHTLQLANGSTALAFPTTGGRSYTATLAVVDEADFSDDLDALLNAVKPTIDAGGRLILVSTADKSKPESAFKRIYRGAVAQANGYRPVFLPWSARPHRTAAWYEEQRADVLARTGAEDDLFQEYPATDFEALAPRSLDRRFAAQWLHGVDAAEDPPIIVGPSIPGLKVWSPPAPGHTYIVGADTAEGNPLSDLSAGSVVDLTGAQIATWAGRVEPAVFGAQIAAISEYYNNAAALVERNNHGHAVLLWLREFSSVPCLPGLDGKPGWPTTGSSKPLAFDNAAEIFRAGAAWIRDRDTLTELATIVGATLAAPAGQHDDRAMAHVLALAALRYCSIGAGISEVITPPDPLIEIGRRF